MIGVSGFLMLLLIAMAGVGIYGYYQAAHSQRVHWRHRDRRDARRFATARLAAGVDPGDESAGTPVHARTVLSVGQGSPDALSPREHVARHRTAGSPSSRRAQAAQRIRSAKNWVISSTWISASDDFRALFRRQEFGGRSGPPRARRRWNRATARSSGSSRSTCRRARVLRARRQHSAARHLSGRRGVRNPRQRCDRRSARSTRAERWNGAGCTGSKAAGTIVLGSLAAVVLLSVGFVQWGVPAIANQVAKVMPVQADRAHRHRHARHARPHHVRSHQAARGAAQRARRAIHRA